MDYFFIVNPTAGGGRAKKEFELLRRYLDSKGIDYSFYITKHVGDALIEVRKQCQLGRRFFVAVGGDGTANEVVNGFAEYLDEVTFGIIPVGTGNDFAYPLGIPHDTISAFEFLSQATPKPTNLMRANERYALSFITTGIDLEIVRLVNNLPKKQPNSYNKMMVKAFFTFKGYNVQLKSQGINYHKNTYLIAFSNTGSVSSGVKLSLSANVQSDTLSMLVMPFCNKLRALKCMLNFKRNKFEMSKGVDSYQIQSVELTLNDANLLDIDGELVEGNTFVVSLQKNKLNMLR